MGRRWTWIADSFRKNGPIETLRYLKNTLYLLIVRKLLKRKFLRKKIHGLSMNLRTDDPGISRTLAVKGTREKDQIYIVRQELSKGMTVLDIGANIGMYALLEADIVGSKGKVYAIEPSPQNFELLNRNIALNKFENIIEANRAGASNRTGMATFYLHDASNLHTFHPAKYNEFKNEPQTYRETIEVEVVNVAEFVKGKRPIDFIRMDIEGYEVEVLEGLQEGILQGILQPEILFEVHRPKYDDIHHSMRVQLQKLFAQGYYPKAMISTDESLARFREKGYVPQTTTHTDGVIRGIYTNISKSDAIEFICDIGYVRAALLAV